MTSCICVYIFECVCIGIYVCINVCIDIYTYIFYNSIYKTFYYKNALYIYVCVCVCMFLCFYVCVLMFFVLHRIMMLSVLKNTQTKVKFWFLKNFLSPTFKVCDFFYCNSLFILF